MNMAQNILVIKTASGMAMAVAAALDAMNCNEIVTSNFGQLQLPDIPGNRGLCHMKTLLFQAVW